MKILQLVPELNVGGVERGTIDLARVLISKGHEAHVISAGGVLVGELEKIGAKHLELPIHKKSLKTLLLVKKVVNYIEEHGINIVHGRSRVPAWIGYLACRYTDADFITTCHGYYSTHFLSTVMGWGKRVIVISNVIGRHMIDDFKVPEDRIRLVPRGIDLQQFPYRPLKDRFPDRGEPVRIISVGRITPLKGHKDFIRALHWVKQRGKNFEAWIVGSAPQKKQHYFKEIEKLVDRFGLRDRVKFLGTRQDIPELLKEAHISVLSTTTPEAFGRVVAEAGAVGTAVVTTEVGGVTDIVRKGKDGRLVPPHDPIKMADALCEAIDDREKTFEFSESLHKRVQENFHLEQMYEKTLKVYGETHDEQRILVIKLGALGDLVLITPSLRLLRRRYPKAFISLLVDEPFYELALSLPFVDEVLVYHRSKSRGGLRRYLKLLSSLRQQGFDMTIDFQNIPKTHLLSFLSGTPKRLGYDRGSFGFLLTSGAKGHKDTLPPIQHQFRVLRCLGLGVGHQDETLELNSSPKAQEVVSGWLGEKQVDSVFVTLSLSASHKWPTKNWDLDNYVELGKLTRDAYPGVRFILIGTEKEKKIAAKFQKNFTDSDTLNLVGKTSINEMGEVIRRSQLVIAPDSAPLHMAAAFKVPALGLFGPTSAERHAPPNSKQTLFQKKVDCGPCYSRECVTKTHECMKLITPKEVFLAVKKYLDDRMRVTQNIENHESKAEETDLSLETKE
jgi:lipopolysaccharide heptosyltransferase II